VSLAQLWIIFSLSFVMSLSGALMPGPLLTYTIARTLRSAHGGWLTGPRVIAGHAALEGILLCGLVLGVVEFLRAPLAAKIIGVAGAMLLLYMGVGLILETLRGRGIDISSPDAREDPPAAGVIGRMHPVLAGALVSMGNPYWWIWWVTIGSAFLLRFDISLSRWQGLAAFFLGHEAGDLGWYTLVSAVLHFGRKGIPRAAGAVILGICGVVIIGFAFYLGISPFLSR
jgi:threonine/homoserine/homoserine lactone efflux protein